MKFSALEPRFVRYETRVESSRIVEGDAETWRERGMPTREVVGPKEYSITVQSLAEAQGFGFSALNASRRIRPELAYIVAR